MRLTRLLLLTVLVAGCESDYATAKAHCRSFCIYASAVNIGRYLMPQDVTINPTTGECKCEYQK